MNKKYKPGAYIVSLDHLMEQEFVYCAGKLIHKGWFSSWQLRYAKMSFLGFIFGKPSKRRWIHDSNLDP